MKKTIRLTEGMLRQMVKEAIDELDWKTYQSAADKQPRKYSRSYDDGLNGKFGCEYHNEIRKVFQDKLEQMGISEDELAKRDFDTWMKLWRDSEIEVATKERKMYQRQRNFKRSAEDAFDRDFGFEDETGYVNSEYGRFGNNQLGATMYNRNSYGLKPSKELQAAYQRASKEAADFDPRNSDGLRLPSNYKYEKGNGWKLKNDELDEAISKAIRRVLR